MKAHALTLKARIQPLNPKQVRDFPGALAGLRALCAYSAHRGGEAVARGAAALVLLEEGGEEVVHPPPGPQASNS